MKNSRGWLDVSPILPAAVSFLITALPVPSAYGDEALFVNHCGVCHTLNPDDPPRQGPHLNGLFGRKAGAVEGFPYSASLGGLDLAWDADNLDRWLENPQSLASDSYMIYKQDDPAIRAAIVDYLLSL